MGPTRIVNWETRVAPRAPRGTNENIMSVDTGPPPESAPPTGLLACCVCILGLLRLGVLGTSGVVFYNGPF